MSEDFTVWKTKNGKRVHVQQMTEVHIWNTITMIRRKLSTGGYLKTHVCEWQEPCAGCDNNSELVSRMERWIEALQTELLRRGMSPEPIWDVLDAANKRFAEEEERKLHDGEES